MDPQSRIRHATLGHTFQRACPRTTFESGDHRQRICGWIGEFVCPSDSGGVSEAGGTSCSRFGEQFRPCRASQCVSEEPRGNCQCVPRQVLGSTGQHRLGGGFSVEVFCVAELSLLREREIPPGRTPCVGGTIPCCMDSRQKG